MGGLSTWGRWGQEALCGTPPPHQKEHNPCVGAPPAVALQKVCNGDTTLATLHHPSDDPTYTHHVQLCGRPPRINVSVQRLRH